jgi:hypothetical protein
LRRVAAQEGDGKYENKNEFDHGEIPVRDIQPTKNIAAGVAKRSNSQEASVRWLPKRNIHTLRAD